MVGSKPSAHLPDFVEPMQAKLVDSMRPGDWLYEVKFDGYRTLALRGGSETRILSRNQNDLAFRPLVLCPAASGPLLTSSSRRSKAPVSKAPNFHP